LLLSSVLWLDELVLSSVLWLEELVLSSVLELVLCSVDEELEELAGG
jgi:hypothetical protein